MNLLSAMNDRVAADLAAQDRERRVTHGLVPMDRPREYFEELNPSRGVLPPRADARSDAPTLSLDGQWGFRLLPTAQGDLGFIHDDPPQGEEWTTIPVPAHWQLNGHGSPAYTNRVYPFPVDPPYVPEQNPTGDYRRTFEVPAAWDAERILLRFDGVDSLGRVWLNGIEIGIVSGSRLRSEFDITEHVRHDGPNVLAVRVHQWSSGTYLEDQDMWWLSGIFRSVTLLARPVGAIDDHFVHADYDAVTGEGVLRVDASAPARVRVDELGIDVAAGESVRIPVQPWSAEQPRLYAGQLAGAGETIDLRIGFRRVEVTDGAIHVNGRPILLRGTNRHDFDPDTGRAVTEERMRSDIVMMKQYNVNAVRTSHYPPQARFLELCDELGLWVMDECDFETHGFYPVDWFHELPGNPASDPRWREGLVDRMARLVERDKNRPSVIMWSLGNECGTGENLGAMSRYAKDRDPSRLLHYERDWSCEYVDVYSRMYSTHRELQLLGTRQEAPFPDADLDARRRAMPFLLCEYVHSMGNGPGGLAEYQELFERHPRLAGGFTWEWFDQGLRARTPDGREYFAYGGDFGEQRHDGNFVADGVVFPDGTPSPGLHEMKKVFEPIRFEQASGGTLIRNLHDDRDLSHVRILWSVSLDGEETAAGETQIGDVPSGASAFVALPEVPGASADGAGEVVITFRAVLAVDTSWAGAGHEIAWGEFVVAPRSAPPALTTVRPVVDGTVLRLGPAEFDERTGDLRSIGGVSVAGLRFDTWRATIDNDRAFSWDPYEARWRTIGLDRPHQRSTSVTITGGEIIRRSRLGFDGSDLGFDTTLTWTASTDELRLRVEASPHGDWDVPLPRFGLRMALPDSFGAVEWYGPGPGEAYSDSHRAARLGRWQRSIDELQTPYVMPQENGNRREARWLRLASSDTVFEVDAADSVDFSARRWRTEDLDAASHQYELVPSDRIWLNLDVGQTGLGSGSCGPGALPAQRLLARTFDYSMSFRVISDIRR